MNGLHADGSKASGFRSTVVAQFTAVSLQKDDRAFAKYNKSTYLLPGISAYPTINASPSASAATVTIETDTVSGASPYIFNCSLRSVWGMNGLHADGSKASGFKSTVVAQFTTLS